MSASRSYIVTFAVLCAVGSAFLAILNLDERAHFGRVLVEILLVMPLAIWLLGRRLRPGH